MASRFRNQEPEGGYYSFPKTILCLSPFLAIIGYIAFFAHAPH